MSRRTVTHNGETLTIRDWASRCNQSAQTLRYRLDAGWPVALALTAPISNSGRKSSGDIQNAIQERKEREFNHKAAHVRREFDKLVRDIDRALTAFHTKIDWLLNEEADAPGVGQDSIETPCDRTTRSSQDRA